MGPTTTSAEPAPIQTLPIRSAHDLVRVRQAVRALATACGFGLVDQTKVVTAASELARNTLDHGKGGEVRIARVEDGGRVGVRLEFEDSGPGIPDTERALQDGFTTAGGLGLGLGGARRLSHEFALVSQVGQGTRVTMTRWKSS